MIKLSKGENIHHLTSFTVRVSIMELKKARKEASNVFSLLNSQINMYVWLTNSYLIRYKDGISGEAKWNEKQRRKFNHDFEVRRVICRSLRLGTII